jgi:hypothetical protein
MELWQKVADYVAANFNPEPETEPMAMFTDDAPAEPREDYTFLVDVYSDPDAQYAILSRGGKLYRADIAISGNDVVLGDLSEVMTTFTPTESRCLVTRQADGRDRWLIVAGTTVLNREAEIDSAELFDNFIRRAKDSGRFPYLTFFHLKEAMRMGQADFLGRDGVAYIASGLFDDTPLARACAVALQRDRGYWGASNGFYPLAGDMLEVADGIKVPVYTDGEHEEISILPERAACSLFTAAKGVERMNERIREALVKLTGGDEAQAAEFAALVDDINRTVADTGMIHRDAAATVADSVSQPANNTETEPETEERTAEVDPVAGGDAGPAEPLQVRLDDAARDAIVSAIMERPEVQNLLGMGEKLAAEMRAMAEAGAVAAQQAQALAGRVKELERAQRGEDRLIAADRPRGRALDVTYRPRSGAAGETEEKRSMADLAAATLANLK